MSVRKPTQPYTQDELVYIERETERALVSGGDIPLSEDVIREGVTLAMEIRQVAGIAHDLYNDTGDDAWLRSRDRLNELLRTEYQIK